MRVNDIKMFSSHEARTLDQPLTLLLLHRVEVQEYWGDELGRLGEGAHRA